MAPRIAYVDHQIILDIPALQASVRESRVKKSLLALLTQEHDFTQRRRAYAHKRGIEANDGDGMGAGFCEAGANLKTQETVLGILAPIIPSDDEVYTAVWETALGKHSNILNLSYGAIDTLSAMASRKEDLLTKARDPRNKIYERTCAYTILCLPHLPGEQGIALLEEIVQDRCVQSLYNRNKELSPDAQHELKLEQISKRGSKQRAVDEAQRRMHLAVFDVVWHAAQHSPRFVLYLPENSKPLTDLLCRLALQHPSHHSTTLANYGHLRTIPTEDRAIIYDTLKTLAGTQDIGAFSAKEAFKSFERYAGLMKN